ncbi:MAG: host specificity protein [Planctomycetaceae bacterium]|nr:host specificity protein [Planctomycetaceae bacterium]
MSHSIRERLSAGKTVRVMSMGVFPDPKLIEIAGLIGNLHGLWIDQEHSAVSHAQLEMLLMACRASGLDAFARVAPTDYATIMRPMEAGCSGVMAAQIRTLEEVAEVIHWSKYPPLGTRGLFMANAEAKYATMSPAEHVEQSNRERWLAIQIETTEAVDQVDEIAATAGVDMLFVGPGDLACTLGVPGQALHPLCIAALERISAACKKHGKPWGTLTRHPDHAAKCRDLGCQLFSICSDVDIVQRGIQSTRELFAELDQL